MAVTETKESSGFFSRAEQVVTILENWEDHTDFDQFY